MFRQRYFLGFKTRHLLLTVRLNGITVVRHQDMDGTVQLDRWLRPGFNRLSLHFESDAQVRPGSGFSASGRLYAVDRDASRQRLLARFKWSHGRCGILLPFDDQFEFLVE